MVTVTVQPLTVTREAVLTLPLPVPLLPIPLLPLPSPKPLPTPLLPMPLPTPLAAPLVPPAIDGIAGVLGSSCEAHACRACSAASSFVKLLSEKLPDVAICCTCWVSATIWA
ncbi:MAG: hypothetical protein EOO40_10245 [Deltaproteobacteria bacterium]|nr:MAG: hypothetical protein EOO40_10245 [Deltaproteobacteria bacterium]